MLIMPGLQPLHKKYKQILEKAFVIRLVEEKLLSLFSANKLNGTIHTCIGQELIGVVLNCFIDGYQDYCFSNHRGHGHFISYTDNVEGLISEIMGKPTGICGGIGGSQHLHANKFFSNGIQGGMTPVATGCALAASMDSAEGIAVVFVGDGTLGEGVLYETLNIASVWNIPVLFVLENNKYAQSTSMKQTFAGNVSERIRGFGIEYMHTNTYDLDDLFSSCEHAVSFVRNQTKPLFLEIDTYRLKAHSKGDDNRNALEVQNMQKKDLLTSMIQEYFSAKELSAIEQRVDDIIDNIDSEVAEVDYESSFFNVSVNTDYKSWKAAGRKDTCGTIIYSALKDIFADERFVMLGEDIEYKTDYTEKPYGGAFNISKDLSELYKGRVRNTPISEAAIVGIGTGLAIAGKRPIIEIMFGDFLTLAFDQIMNHASKFYQMYNKKVKVPLIIRTPMGGGKGYGPTHSQSLEKFFLGIYDVYIFALNDRISPEFIYKNIIKLIQDPVIVIENKRLYATEMNNSFLDGFELMQTDDPFPVFKVTPKNIKPDITIAVYGAMLSVVEKVISRIFYEEEILCEIISPIIINPINIEPFCDSLRVTKKILVVEEGSGIAAWGSELIAQVTEAGIILDSVGRVSNVNIIPSSKEGEKAVMVNEDKIIDQIKRMMA